MSIKSEPALTGGCQCVNITYSSSSLPSSFANCHFQTYRKLSGIPFLTFGAFPSTTVTWTSREKSLRTTYSEIAEPTHCAGCGSPISMQYKCSPEMISITTGSIDENSVRTTLPKVSQHIFVEKKEKTGWYDLPYDKIPRYSKYSSEFQRKLDEWKKVVLAPGLG